MRKFILIVTFIVGLGISSYYYWSDSQYTPPRVKLANSSSFPFHYFSWVEPDLLYRLFPLAPYSIKTISSPSGDYIVYDIKTHLAIKGTHAVGETKVTLFPEALSRQYTFLNDEYLLLIEQDKVHDYFSLVDVKTGEKTLLFDSIPNNTGLNLSKKVAVYDKGSKLIMEDNTGELLQLVLEP